MNKRHLFDLFTKILSSGQRGIGGHNALNNPQINIAFPHGRIFLIIFLDFESMTFLNAKLSNSIGSFQLTLRRIWPTNIYR